MFKFPWQKKKDDEEEELEAKPKRTRRKKKEEPKPWGKKERLLVGVFLGISVIGSGVLALSAREWKIPGLPRIDIHSPDLSLEETIVLEAPSSPTPEEQTLIDSFQDKTTQLSGVYGLYVYELNSDRKYGLYYDEQFQAASLIKLPVLVTLYKEAEAKNINLDEEYTLKKEDKIGGAGSLQNEAEGTKITYRRLAELMGQESDNTAYNIVLRTLGQRKVIDTINALGMNHTSIEDNSTTPQDIGKLLTSLGKSTYVSSDSGNEIMRYITDTKFEEWLTPGIPENTRIAHKYGREVHVVNDAGIVFAEKPYVVVIMSKGAIESEADRIFPDLSELVYSYTQN